MRTHIVLPEKLVNDIDTLVGKGKRSQFIEQAVKEKLRKQKLVHAIEETAGILSATDHPEWSTPERVAAWVRESRREWDRRLEKQA